MGSSFFLLEWIAPLNQHIATPPRADNALPRLAFCHGIFVTLLLKRNHDGASASDKSCMTKILKAACILRDLAQLHLLDRFNSERSLISKNAGWYCRTQRFHTRCKIRRLPWSELFQKLGVPAVDQVAIPGPATDFGNVGSTDYYHALGSGGQSSPAANGF